MQIFFRLYKIEDAASSFGIYILPFHSTCIEIIFSFSFLFSQPQTLFSGAAQIFIETKFFFCPFFEMENCLHQHFSPQHACCNSRFDL